MKHTTEFVVIAAIPATDDNAGLVATEGPRAARPTTVELAALLERICVFPVII